MRSRSRRRVTALVVGAAVLAAALTGCTGRKGRNDDDPGPNEYSVRFEPIRHRHLHSSS